MPPLTFLPQYERHLTYTALGHCPQDYAWLREVREGRIQDNPPSDSLALGIIVHLGLAALYQTGWDLNVAMSRMTMMAAHACGRQDINSLIALARTGLQQYADHWGPMRGSWDILAINPAETDPPPGWLILNGNYLAYPDLIVSTREHPVLVIDHKTGRYALKAQEWEYDPQLLTQCLAAEQRWIVASTRPVFYGVDYLQKPGYKTSVWALPAMPVWEFTEEKQERARAWLRLNEERKKFYEETPYSCGFAQDPAQCQTRYGLCPWAVRCFGWAGGEE